MRRVGDIVSIYYDGEEGPPPLVAARVMAAFRDQGVVMYALKIHVDHEVGCVYEVYPETVVFDRKEAECESSLLA